MIKSSLCRCRDSTFGAVAQLVEHGTHKPRVGGSIPPRAKNNATHSPTMIDPITKKLKFPVVQSPMAGCSNLPFRLVSRKRGMEYCFLEMVSANGLVHESDHTKRLLQTIPQDKPVGAQLVGCDPDTMGLAAQKVEDLGFEHLDLNLGCPVRKVTSLGGGAALMENPKKAENVFKSVVKSVKKIPVTIKIRKGFKDDSGRQAVEIAKVAETCGIGAVTVHGRTQAQGYVGPADWGVISLVKKAVNIPVLGNGDVLSVKDAKNLFNQTGCDGIMIGRGGLGNPWLFAEILTALYGRKTYKFPTPEEKKKAVLEHMALEVKYVGVERALFHMRRIGAWYIQGVRNARYWRDQLNRCHHLDGVTQILTDALFETNPQYN